MMITSQKFCFCNLQSFTIRIFLTILGLLIAQHALAQVADSFSDGEFANAPAWSGNDSRFIIENGQLRLTAETLAGSAFLSTPSAAVQDASWECTVRMAFNPSSTNYTRIYIISDSPDLTGILNGYFVMIGDTPDEISLYRQSGSEKTKIIDGFNGRVNLSSVNINVRVTRDSAGNWELFSDPEATGTYISEGTTFDNSWTQTSWFGVLCTYTATRSDDFYFDDFLVTGSPVADIIPPQIKQLNVVSSQAIELIFSEPLNRSTAENITNYTLSPGSKRPQTATLDGSGTTVKLLFADEFENATQGRLSISNVEDLNGNVIEPSEETFFYFEPVAPLIDDIIITEIFPDPEPVEGLPSAEFIELFNRSEKVFDLAGWSISDGSSKAIFPSIYLFPGEYLIVTGSTTVQEFPGVDKIIGLANFPGLNNSEDVLLIRDVSGVLIDAVRYSEAWYHDEDKKSGGWSLELIDPQNLCSEEENWSASEAPKGGTPGEVNSVFANKPDLAGPKTISAIPISAYEVVLHFNEKLRNQLLMPEHFNMDPINEVLTASFTDSLLTSLKITFAQALDTGVTYWLVTRNIYDCTGNQIQEQFNAVAFGVPERAGHMDVVINEILFNPTSTGVDFVELYNASRKFINLRSLRLANASGDISAVSRVDQLLAPNQYIVVSGDRDRVIGEYPSSLESHFVDVMAMPSMNDDEGSVRLIADTVSVDSFIYSDEMHSPFLKDDEGVSLERISFQENTNMFSNWKSASSSSGFATPGFINSNAREESPSDAELRIEPEVFSPLESQVDFVRIHYRFATGGFVANIDVLDSYGRTIFNIANNEILGASGFFRWDGSASDGSKARIGYYMVKVEIFDATGVVRVFKKRLAIASRF